jgi:hypothetical protein
MLAAKAPSTGKVGLPVPCLGGLAALLANARLVVGAQALFHRQTTLLANPAIVAAAQLRGSRPSTTFG